MIPDRGMISYRKAKWLYVFLVIQLFYKFDNIYLQMLFVIPGTRVNILFDLRPLYFWKSYQAPSEIRA